MNEYRELAKAIAAAADEKIAKKKEPRRQTTGRVTSIDPDGTVKVDAGYGNTPALNSSVSVEVGDEVAVTIEGNRATITGNYSRPSTDDSTAIEAGKTAKRAESTASEAKLAADDATTYALEAREAADSAGKSAAQASKDAQAASKAAGEAQADATTANQAAGRAVEDAASAKESAEQALADAGTAKASAEQAVADAKGARDAATQAQADAASAKASAKSAADDAASAKASAAQAVDDAKAAKTSADSAASSAASASTSAGNAATSATNAATSASNAQASAKSAADDASAAKASAKSAKDDADAAKASAASAETSAGSAATSAGNAATSASNAETSAGNAAASAKSAADDASAAKVSAGNAATSASNAQSSASSAATSASNAATSASNAAKSASDAASDASSAKASAERADKHADAALDQLSIVQDVVGVLTWASEHGTFKKTADKSIVAGKVYFVKDGDSYAPVVDPDASKLSTYYEMTVDEAMDSYIMAHLAVTDAGLWVLPSGRGGKADGALATAPGYKALLSNSGMVVYDSTGVAVSTFGESIKFNADRPQRIGGDKAYIEWYDSNNDGKADSLRIVGTNLNTQVDQQSTTITNLTESVKYGGRNLATAEVLAKDGVPADGSVRTYTRGGRLIFTADVLQDYIGETVTISFDIRLGDGAVEGHTVSFYPYQQSGLSIGKEIAVTDITADWKRYSVTGPVTMYSIRDGSTYDGSKQSYTYNNVSYSYGEFWFYDRTGSQKYDVKELKLERGPFATPWEYAAEDVTSMSNTVNSVKQTATANSAKITSLETVNTKNGLTESTNIASRTSAIEQDLSGFKSTVSSTYATQTALASAKTEAANDATSKANAARDAAIAAAEKALESNRPFVTGTQTAATYNWTGTCEELESLEDGQQITYFLPYSVGGTQVSATYTTISSGATTNTTGAALLLTLKGGKKTNNVPIWYGSGMERVTSHYAYGSHITMTYRKDVTMSGTYKIAEGWFVDAEYNSDNVYSRSISGGFFTGKNGVTSYALHMKDENGRWTSIINSYSNTANNKTCYAGGLDPNEVLYCSTWYGNGRTTGDNVSVAGDLWASNIFDFRFSTNINANSTAGKAMTVRKPVYLVGTIGAGGLFYLDTAQWWTQAEPTSADGKVYIYLGIAYSWYQLALVDRKPLYAYLDGKFQESTLARLTTAETAIEQTANNVLIKATKSDTTAAQGAKSLIQSLINVAPEGVQISADKVDIEGAAIFSTGKLAKVVTATQAEWYSSTSATSKAGGSWGTSQPSVVAGRFIWERQKVTYSNGTSEYKPSAEGVCTQGQTNLSAYSTTVQADAKYDAKGAADAANAREQLVYRSAAKGTTSMGVNQTWVTDATGNQNTWTTVRPEYSKDYPVLFVATQRQTVAQSSGTACTCTTPKIDATTTVIDGGNIITNSITAEKLDATTINASGKLTVGALTAEAQASVLNSELNEDLESLDTRIGSVSDSVSSLDGAIFGMEDEDGNHVEGALEGVNSDIESLKGDMSGKVDSDFVIDAINSSKETSGGASVRISGAKLDIMDNVDIQAMLTAISAKFGEADVRNLVASILTAGSLQVGPQSGVHIEQRPSRISFMQAGATLMDKTDAQIAAQSPGVAFDGEVAFVAVDADGTSTFYMNHSVVVNDLSFGHWRWYERSNKHMTLQYVG